MTLKQKHFIDSHKGATALWVLGMMAWYGAWDNTTLWIYLALHGTYGLLWITKSLTFGDKQWEQATGIGYGLVIWGGLSLYWIAPWLIASRGTEAPPWMLAACVALWGFGVFLHFSSDMQKHITLQFRRGLITEGLWARLRNPNYLGELLIYFGFSALAMHWAPLARWHCSSASSGFPTCARKTPRSAAIPAGTNTRREAGGSSPASGRTSANPRPEEAPCRL